MNKDKHIVLKLFITMMKIGIFTFGGGYAMIALLQNEFVIRKKWITEDEFMDMIVVSESTPGPLAINLATYIGYKISGVWGSFAATIGVVIPSFTIIYVISLFFDKFLSLKYVTYAFKGIQICVIYLIGSAGLSLLKSMKKTKFSIAILVSVIAAMVIFSLTAVKISSIVYILLGGILGYIYYLFQSRSGEDRESQEKISTAQTKKRGKEE